MKYQSLEMNWASSQGIAKTAKFLIELGYGYKITKVPLATTTAAASLAETRKPDIATEMWYNCAPVYAKTGKVKTIVKAFKEGALEAWFGYYYDFRAILGKYNMAQVDVGPTIPEVHKYTSDKTCTDTSTKSSYPPVTGVTNAFNKSHSEVTKLMSNISFTNTELHTILAWKQENKASAEEAAVSYIQGNSGSCSKLLNDSAKTKLAALIK